MNKFIGIDFGTGVDEILREIIRQVLHNVIEETILYGSHAFTVTSTAWEEPCGIFEAKVQRLKKQSSEFKMNALKEESEAIKENTKDLLTFKGSNRIKISVDKDKDER